MAGNFYYFCSQLPVLVFNTPPPLTVAEFDVRAADLLGEREAAYLACCSFHAAPDAAKLPAGSAAGLYRRWERALSGEIARLRTAERNADLPLLLPPEMNEFTDLREAVTAAASAPNPLERQNRIDLLRWKKIESLEVGHEFTVEWTACYRLKLSLLEKRRLYREEAGRENFRGAIDRIDRNSAE